MTIYELAKMRMDIYAAKPRQNGVQGHVAPDGVWGSAPNKLSTIKIEDTI